MKWKNKISYGMIEVTEILEHKVRVYENRLAISRLDGKNQTWEELQQVKNSIWGADCVAIEIYPKESGVVNIKPTRHLWKLSENVEREILKQCNHIEFIIDCKEGGFHENSDN